MTGEPRYFLTAYGIALKHGFQGSEEEWLESLTAYGQALAAGYQGSYKEWLQKIVDPVPVFAVGNVETLAAGLPAYVEIHGSKEHPILMFGIPRGEGMEDALMKTGGRMLGSLSMGGFALADLPAPVADGDAPESEHPGLYVQLDEETTVYAVWYEKYQCYIAIRKLTPRECFRLQGWTDEYFERAEFVNSDSQLYKQAGNGVTVNVVQLIGEAIKEVANGKKQKQDA